jgi:hypothetical protein
MTIAVADWLANTDRSQKALEEKLVSWAKQYPCPMGGYGGGFSTLPTLLQSKFGMDKISTIHGFALSAWAWAGLSGNQLSNLIINRLQLSYIDLFTVLGCLYFISLLVTYTIYKNGRVCRV